VKGAKPTVVIGAITNHRVLVLFRDGTDVLVLVQVFRYLCKRLHGLWGRKRREKRKLQPQVRVTRLILGLGKVQNKYGLVLSLDTVAHLGFGPGKRSRRGGEL
jgi:hypothetical protein